MLSDKFILIMGDPVITLDLTEILAQGFPRADIHASVSKGEALDLMLLSAGTSVLFTDGRSILVMQSPLMDAVRNRQLPHVHIGVPESNLAPDHSVIVDTPFTTQMIYDALSAIGARAAS